MEPTTPEQAAVAARAAADTATNAAQTAHDAALAAQGYAEPRMFLATKNANSFFAPQFLHNPSKGSFAIGGQAAHLLKMVRSA